MFNRFAPLQQKLRLDLLDLVQSAGSSHLGGPLSSIDIFATLYLTKIFNFKLDHFVLSAGHLAPAYYTVLAHAGYFPKSRLKTYSRFKSALQGHVSTSVPGVEYNSGSLGQGLSFAAGLALGDPHYSVCLTSDAEHQQGQIWEAIAFANKYKLKNLINIIDKNNLQIDGSTDSIMPLLDLSKKYHSFGWRVITVDGHNINKLITALKQAKTSTRPTCIIAKTVMGKGIKDIENNFNYHDVKNLPADFYAQARHRLNS